MGSISVVINTLNEEKNIERAITSISDFADEIIVCDMNSDDKTSELASKMGAKIYKHKRVGYVEPARNFAIAKANSDWVLVLDADEEIGIELCNKLKEISSQNDVDYVRIARKNIIFNKWIKHSFWWPDYNIRFFRKNHVVWDDAIHGIPITSGVGTDLQTTEDFSIIHHEYQTVEQFIDRLNRYTTIQAKNLTYSGKHFLWRDLIIKPTQEFCRRYFSEEGYKDGIHGLALSLLQAFSEVVLYCKLWQNSKFENKQIPFDDFSSTFKKSISEIAYWIANVEIAQKANFISRIKRKFKIL